MAHTVSEFELQSKRILKQAGFQIRGNRATCPFCEGTRRLTVSIHEELYYCHRCGRGGSVRMLARSRGLGIPPRRIRLADRSKQQFQRWLGSKMTKLSNRERHLARRVEWAKAALKDFPEMEQAWAVLGKWYYEQRVFETFWQSANDKIGRYWLYRAWRNHAH